MNEVFLRALAERIKIKQMTIDQVPELFRESVKNMLEEDIKDNG